MCFYLRNWQVTFLLYTLGVFMSEYIAKASIEPRDYRVVFLIQRIPRVATLGILYTLISNHRQCPVKIFHLVPKPV